MRRIVLTLVVAVALPISTWSQDRGFGVGLMLGEPIGLSGKTWLSQQNAVDFGLAYSFRSKGYFHIHADYLWQFPHVIQSEERFSAYVGIGGRFALGKGSGIVGVRIPIGAAFWLGSAPIEFFIEGAPILDLAPATGLSGNGGIGARFYFR